MILLSWIALVVCVVFTELSLPLALLLTGFAAMLGCSLLALTCPRRLKDDSLFRADVI
ncbi:MAG: hypothetical protein ABI383_05410 [Acidobacteriaceae bacterium]